MVGDPSTIPVFVASGAASGRRPFLSIETTERAQGYRPGHDPVTIPTVGDVCLLVLLPHWADDTAACGFLQLFSTICPIGSNRAGRMECVPAFGTAGFACSWNRLYVFGS